MVVAAFRYWGTTLPVALLFFYSAGLCLAQSSHLIFEHITKREGLSTEKMVNMIQDREGFYWFATQNGLNRYDGTSFTTYYHHPDDSTSLAHNYCTAILEDAHGDIWVTTYGGLCRYTKRNGKFETISLSSDTSITARSYRLTNMATDGDSTIWITGNGLWKYTIHSKKIVYYPPEEQNKYAPSGYAFIRHIVYDPVQKGFWITLGDELNFYDTHTGQFYRRQNNPKQWKIFDSSMPGPIALDSKSRLWYIEEQDNTLSMFSILTNTLHTELVHFFRSVMNLQTDPLDRVWILYWSDHTEIYDPVSGEVSNDFFQQYHSLSVLSPRVNAFYVDIKGNTWILSDNGVSVFHPQNQYYKIYPLDLAPFSDKSAVITIYGGTQTSRGHIWLGTDVGLMELELISGRLRKIEIPLPSTVPDKFELPYQKSRVTAVHSRGSLLYLGLQDRLICYDVTRDRILTEFKLMGNVQFIQTDPEGNIWVGTWLEGLYRVNPVSKAIHHYKMGESSTADLKTNSLITGLQENNNVWIGYNGGHGFAQMNLSTSSWTQYLPAIDQKTSYAYGTITAIARSNDFYWLGTYGGGLIRFDPKTNIYEAFQQEQGLKSNYVNNIISDAYDRLWISTADGLSLFDLPHNSIQPMSIDLQFPSNDYVNSGYAGLEGKIYFFESNKIIEIDPAVYQFDNTFPRVVVSRFSIFEEEADLPLSTEKIQLTHQQNFFSFTFSAVKSHPQKKVQYAYKLEGFDPDWVETSTSPYAGYTNVPPGEYRFMIRVKNETGQWSDTVWSRDVLISPPFWLSGWFIALSTLTFVGMLYGVHRYRINQVKKIFSIRTQISRDLHDDIGASLSSIHIYSTVAESEMEDDPQKAKAFLQQINTNSRQVMEDISDIVWANRLQDQEHTSISARIKNYGYDLLSQKNIRCIYNIDPEIEKRLSKPDARRNVLLIIKESFNNIAKYSQASEAEVVLATRGNELYLSIYDNGVGFDTTAEVKGNGLAHMRKRAEAMEGKMELSSQPGHGTRVTCHIPITKISDRFF